MFHMLLRGGYGEFLPKYQFFLILLNAPHTMPDWFVKYQEASIFFPVQKNYILFKIFFFVFPNSDE